MKTNFISSLLIALLISLFSANNVLAHGVPTITVQPEVAAPGSQITITGSDMEDGEVFRIALEGMSGTVQLGEAIAKQDGDEAGFTVNVTLPRDLAAGSYVVDGTTDDGESATADLTIAASSEQTNTQPMEANAELLALDRSKSPLVIGSVIVLALISAGLGIGLVRWRE